MIAITNGKVVTITQGTFDNGTVLVEDGKIKAVGLMPKAAILRQA